MGDYEIGASIPVQAGKGKLEKGKDNTEAVVESAGTRNEKYGFIEIKAEKTPIKREDLRDER